MSVSSGSVARRSAAPHGGDRSGAGKQLGSTVGDAGGSVAALSAARGFGEGDGSLATRGAEEYTSGAAESARGVFALPSLPSPDAGAEAASSSGAGHAAVASAAGASA